MGGVTAVLARSVFAAVLGMFYFGFNTGVVNAPETAIKVFIAESHKSHYNVTLDPGEEGVTVQVIFTFITSAFIVGGMVGAMGGGMVADKMGRKRGLIISQVIGLLGGVIMAVSKPLLAWEVLLVGRLVVGLTAGLNTVLVTLYVSEIAPVDLRGGLGVFNQLAVTFGIFLGQVLGLSSVLGNSSGWPWLLAVTVIPPLLQLIILVWSPRSPRYLAITLKMPEAARKELIRLRGGDDLAVDQELQEMQDEAEAEHEPELSIPQLLISSKLRLPLIICVVMHLSQQFSGMVAIFYYSVTFFKSAGYDEEKAQYANLGVGAIMVVMTLVTIPLMDRVGRRVLHITGLTGMWFFAAFIVVGQNIPSLPAGAVVICTLCFVVFFALGPGSIPWMIAGEIFTQGPRPAATSVVVFVNWASNLTVSLLFPLVILPELKEFTFLPFAILIFLFSVFIFRYLPETKGRTVSETSAGLQGRGWKYSWGGDVRFRRNDVAHLRPIRSDVYSYTET